MQIKSFKLRFVWNTAFLISKITLNDCCDLSLIYRVLFLFLLGASSLPLLGQHYAEGYVYDAASNEPLFGAAVYYEGTTKGTITNEQGKFIIDLAERSTSNLVISYLGYQDQIVMYGLEPIEVYLKLKLESLGEVTIQGNLPFTREEMLQAFKEQFLGRTVAGQSCKILNEDALFFYYDTDSFSLKATVDEALIVVNKYLGYEIRYKLYGFKVDFIRKSIKTWDEKRSYYAGIPFFKDLKPNQRKYVRRRKRVFAGSSLELLRIIATQDYESEPYKFFSNGFLKDPKDIFEVKDYKGIKKVLIKDKITVLYRNDEQSTLSALSEFFTIDGFGNYKADSLIFSGVMGLKRLGDTLPLDYGL
jgi:hypothetical protein